MPIEKKPITVTLKDGKKMEVRRGGRGEGRGGEGRGGEGKRKEG